MTKTVLMPSELEDIPSDLLASLVVNCDSCFPNLGSANEGCHVCGGWGVRLAPRLEPKQLLRRLYRLSVQHLSQTAPQQSWNDGIMAALAAIDVSYELAPDTASDVNECALAAVEALLDQQPPAWRDVESAPKNGAICDSKILELLRQAYLSGIDDTQSDCEQWCEQGSSERIEELIEEWKESGILPLPGDPE